MTEEMRKRLEEAAEKYVFSLPLPSIERTYCATKEDFLAGAELGYKEAIKVAKKWLLEQGKIDTLDAVELDMQMNKLWEEKK